MLAARIDRLGPEDKRLLQAAAVIGTDVPFELLQAVADEPEDRLRQGLAQLQATEFLYETRLFPDLEYTFRHALTHEVAYSSLLADRRRALHARIVRAIEAVYGNRLAEHVEQLAHHALRGEAWDKAVAYSRQAGLKAAGRSANREAVACFDQALGALEHLPEGRETLEQAIDLRLDLRNSLFPLGEHGRIIDRLREAEPLAERLDDPRRLGFVFTYTCSYFWMTGEPVHAIEWGQRALALAETCGDFPLQVSARFRLGESYHLLGDYPRAMDLLRSNVASLESEQLRRERFGDVALPSVLSRVYLVYCLAECGEFAEGIARAEEGLQIATAADHPFSLIIASLAAGSLYLRKGNLQDTISVLERNLSLCEARNLPQGWPPTAATLGLAYALSGRVVEAVPLLEQALERAASMRRLMEYALWTAWLAEVRRLAGRWNAALDAARRAFEYACERKIRGQQAWALRVLGEIASHRDPPDVEKAADHYRQAVALAKELGMRPLVAHCHLGLGRLYHRTGKRQEAREHLNAATTMYREMDMGFWLEQAEAEIRGLA